ncbi:MAG TPA: hypothetical protein VGY66_23095 [Gemmataceae bacterium]|jgi:hypothetical protein|nr:hypothetical protein [Gemmataceae bacterium]
MNTATVQLDAGGLLRPKLTRTQPSKSWLGPIGTLRWASGR